MKCYARPVSITSMPDRNDGDPQLVAGIVLGSLCSRLLVGGVRVLARH